ncbi:hypothetical protein SDC9_168717 [bioreactor metagenome]|uniref:Uncharacterized protein n=1 Tax=bioreactor metagenome TaxID=1076179 RepID=A0A645G3A3_9ZZZZ
MCHTIKFGGDGLKILIDADGCPVVDLTVETAKDFGLECVIFFDTSHVFENDYARTVMVSKGTDSVDFALVNEIGKNDIAVTQDYGLAAMCLAKGALPINQDGRVYTEKNIGSLLEMRHVSKKIRRAGGRTKGPKKREPYQSENFAKSLRNLIELQLRKEFLKNE